MENQHESVRGRLLANEQWDSPSRKQYEQAVQSLVAQKLSPLQRWSLSLVALALVPACVLFVWLAATQSELPVLARLLLAEGSVFTVVAIGYIAVVLKRGVFHRRRTPTFVAGLMWIFAVLLSVHFIALIPLVKDPTIAIHFLGISMIAMIGAGLQLLRVCVEQSELNTHERMLEMLYRLSEKSLKAGE